MGKRWAAEELAALDKVSGMTGMAAFHKFGELTGYSRDFNAFEVKRRRATADSPATRSAMEMGVGSVALAEAPVLMGIPSEYVGFRIGFFDIETTFSTQPIVLYAAVADQFGNVEQFRKGVNIIDDRDLVEQYSRALEKYDVLVSWNGALFDLPVLKGRALFHGFASVEPHMHIDLMYKATGGAARIGRKSLQSVSEYFDVPNRKTPLNVRTWDRAMSGDNDAYEKIVEHCDADCLVLRDVFKVLKRSIRIVHRAS